MSQNYCIKFKKLNRINDLTKYRYNSENITDCYSLLVKSIEICIEFFYTIEQLELENKARAFLSRRKLLEYSEQPYL